MEKFRYGKAPFDFTYTYDNIEVVGKYDDAEKKFVEAFKGIEALPKVAQLKRLHVIITDFVYGVLGKESVVKVLGENPTITKLIEFKNTLVQYVAKRMSEENTAVNKG